MFLYGIQDFGNGGGRVMSLNFISLLNNFGGYKAHPLPNPPLLYRITKDTRGFPPTSRQTPSTSGSSDCVNWGPQKARYSQAYPHCTRHTVWAAHLSTISIVYIGIWLHQAYFLLKIRIATVSIWAIMGPLAGACRRGRRPSGRRRVVST